MSAQSSLNLARKWRPQRFDEVVGQSLPLSMLKNSLFLNKLFPVYIFSGKRGCGKTTTARIFAAALNCDELETFRSDPGKMALPCLICPSCKDMTTSRHPDFIEIDAASHTGVDNVRHIIESSAHLPLSGRTKIYLIDEAHMLSRAAFNAFLKVLEEPPPSVRFILATTELHKIPDTVRSRAFQLFFNAIGGGDLHEYLVSMCEKEGIVVQDEALSLIVAETEGSARDAINLLERVRFSGTEVTKELVLQALGRISEETLLELFGFILKQDTAALLKGVDDISAQGYDPSSLWDMVVQLSRTLLWLSHGVHDIAPSLASYKTELLSLLKFATQERLLRILRYLFSQEQIFLKTSHKRHFLEITLLSLYLDPITDRSGSIGGSPAPFSPSLEKGGLDTIQASNKSAPPRVTPTLPASVGMSAGWETFKQQIAQHNDPLLQSIISQASLVGKGAESCITIGLATKSRLLIQTLDENKSTILAALKAAFPQVQSFKVHVPDEALAAQKKKAVVQATDYTKETLSAAIAQSKASPAPSRGGYARYSRTAKKPPFPSGEVIDISDAAKWPKAQIVVNCFGGRVEKLTEEVVHG